MTAKRPKALKWTGVMFPDGRPERHLAEYGIPPRDLTEEETDALSAEQVQIVRESGLYEEVSSETKDAVKAAKEGEGS